MKTIIVAIIVLGICVLGMCVGIIFRKDGKFPETDLSKNEEMRKRSIRCMKEVDDEIFSGKKGSKEGVACDGGEGSACNSCSFYIGAK